LSCQARLEMMHHNVVKEFEFAAKNPLASILKECVQRALITAPTATGIDCTNTLKEKFIMCNSIIGKMSKEYGDLTNQMLNVVKENV
jgi:hypothetical protein